MSRKQPQTNAAQPATVASVELRMAPITWLKRAARNVKEHSETQITAMRGSIQRFGFCDPIGCLASGEIVEGHGRLEASLREGLTEIPVIVIHGMNAAEARAYAIAHNQTTANTGLDQTAVQADFMRIGVRPDDYLSLGFTQDDALFFGVDEGSGPATDHNGHGKQNLKQHLPTVLNTTIEFDNPDQAMLWAQFTAACRDRYDAETISSRLDAFMQEFADGY